MKREPYLMLGCSSGTIRVAGLVNASGSTVTEARQVRALKMMAYTSKHAMAHGGFGTSMGISACSSDQSCLDNIAVIFAYIVLA